MKTNRGFETGMFVMILGAFALIAILVASAIYDTKERTPAEEKQMCLDKININVELNSLPARCLKYVEMPDKLIDEKF